ncbi:MAG: MarR family transcriptional regulator [Rubrivivax sp.]|nr:MarR family transcriptional regulator [Rubrivivax sp.]
MPALAPPHPSVPPDQEAPARVLQRFRQVFTAARAHYQQVEKQVGIGGAQVWALGVIASQPGLGVGSLARAMHVHQSTASNLVRALTERNLVAAAREGSDKRAVQLRLLPAGLALLAQVPGPFTGLLPQALDQLDADTLARLQADLTTLIHAMGMADDAPALPIAQL